MPRSDLTSNTPCTTQNLGELFATIDELNTTRAAMLERVERLNHRLDINLLDKINATAKQVARSNLKRSTHLNTNVGTKYLYHLSTGTQRTYSQPPTTTTDDRIHEASERGHSGGADGRDGAGVRAGDAAGVEFGSNRSCRPGGRRDFDDSPHTTPPTPSAIRPPSRRSHPLVYKAVS